MSLVTCNGSPILAMTLTLPLNGPWVVSTEVDTDEVLTGAIEIVGGTITYAGTILRSDVVGPTCLLEAIGGAGGLRKQVDARSYWGIDAKSVLADLLASVGETLSGESTASVLARTLPYWTRAGGTAGGAIASLAAHLGASWRVLQSGATWLGVDSWPDVDEAYEATELDRDGAASSVLLATDTIDLAPGVTFDGRHVGRVEHHASRSEPLRTTFWVE